MWQAEADTELTLPASPSTAAGQKALALAKRRYSTVVTKYTRYHKSVERPVFNAYIFMKISGRHLRVQDCGLLCRSHFSHVYCILWVRRGCLDIRNWTAVRYTGSLFIIVAIGSRVVKTDQLFQNSPSKPSNGQPSEGLLQTFFILKAITTSCLELKFSDCPMLYPKVSN